MEEVVERKRALRREMAKLREAVTPSEAHRVGVAVARLVEASPEFAEAEAVALFAARADELDTRPLFECARGAGKTCLLPRCTSAAELEFAVLDAWGELVPGRYGIAEPAAGAPVRALGAGQLALIPGVAFDAAGGRLGRGNAFYDRYLARQPHSRAIRFGVGFAFQLVAEVPVEAHDQRLHGVVTEAGLVRVGGGPGGAQKT